MSKPRVLIADDHALIAEGLKTVLSNEFEVVGIVQEGRAVVSEAERLKPDIVVLDISMPLLNGIEAARKIKRILPSTKLVFVTQRADRAYVHAAFQAGASGYILKQSSIAELLPAMHEAIQGHFYVTPQVRKGIPEALINPGRNPSELFGGSLTLRQREVLQLVAEGKTAKEIAAILHVSFKTIEFHKVGIMETLGLRTTAELVRYALEHGIVGG